MRGNKRGIAVRYRCFCRCLQGERMEILWVFMAVAFLVRIIGDTMLFLSFSFSVFMHPIRFLSLSLCLRDLFMAPGFFLFLCFVMLFSPHQMTSSTVRLE